MRENFIESLMNHIMEATMIPKAQVERAVGPILSMFLPEVLTGTFQGDPDLSGEIVIICPEFPLKKTHNRQSTNIDWLMFNKNRKMLLFVELKTSDTSVNENQNAIYQEHIRQIKAIGGGFLLRDVEVLRDASKESGKYQYLLEKRIAPYRDQIAISHAARLIYLVPKSAQHRVQGYADRVLSFSDLAETISSPFALEWEVIHRELLRLDQISQRSRNRLYRHAEHVHSGHNLSGGINYKDKLPLQEILNLIKTRGDSIVIGFSGGRNGLENSHLAYLEQRLFKWDDVNLGSGVKDLRNWIPGKTFVWVIERKAARQEQIHQVRVVKKATRSVNWSGTCKFHEMVRLCQEHGDDILIGFTGGKAAFGNASVEALKNRPHYKWDWASRPAKRNRADWLLGRTVLDLLKRYHQMD
jgi:hypothetical protein